MTEASDGGPDIRVQRAGPQGQAHGAYRPIRFWLADALLHVGRGEEARALFERLLAKANDLGLYAEEVDPATEAFLGNFPQASRTSR